jgi:hypothetical protein
MQARRIEQLGHVRHAAHILQPIGLRKSQVAAQATAQRIAIQKNQWLWVQALCPCV